MKKIILASASPRRSELLRQIGVDFEVVPSEVDETNDLNLDPEEYAIEISYRKASDISKKIDGKYLIVAADTIVVKNGIMGKPKDENEAFQMLKGLQDTWHEVITGIVVIDTESGSVIRELEKTRVKMKPLSDLEIKCYIKSGEPMDKAGSYGIQGLGALIVEKIEGCYFNVVGLPLNRLSTIMKEFGVNFITDCR